MPNLGVVPAFVSSDKLQRSPEQSVSVDNKKVLSFEEVPGPLIFRQIAKVWSVIPVVGTEVTASAIQYMLSAGKLFGNFVDFCFTSFFYMHTCAI